MKLRTCRRCRATRLVEEPSPRQCPCRSRVCSYAPCGRVFRPLEVLREAQRYCSPSCRAAASRSGLVDLAGLLSRATLDDATGCRLWQGSADAARVGVDGASRPVARAAAVLAGILDGWADPRFACHRCDRPGCIEPQHLYAGDAAANSRDAVVRGRMGKLSHDQVRAIRADPRRNAVVAAAYGVHRSTIERARKGQRWALVHPASPAAGCDGTKGAAC